MRTEYSGESEREASLYRRLPMEWWRKHQSRGTLSPIPVSRFLPSSNDVDGLSVSRAEISTIEVASTTVKGKRECLAEFPVAVVSARGLTVQPKPIDHDPGHAVIPEINYAARQDSVSGAAVQAHAFALAQASTIVWPVNGGIAV